MTMLIAILAAVGLWLGLIAIVWGLLYAEGERCEQQVVADGGSRYDAFEESDSG